MSQKTTNGDTGFAGRNGQPLCFCGDYVPVRALDTEMAPGLRVANLECAFADAGVASGKAYTSVLPPDRATEENVGRFAALSVANNHVCDAGDFTAQLRRLEAKFPNVRFFGTVEHPYAELDADGKRVAVIGCLERCRSRGSRIFREEDVLPLLARLKIRFDRVYVCPHRGKESEYTRYPSPRQIRLAHRWIDAGADGVFGSHSHVFQGRELYRGKPVYYSLGNFCFPHPESALYPGTDWGLTVRLNDDGGAEPGFHRFDGEGNLRRADTAEGIALLDRISSPLEDWSMWRWGRRIGGLYIGKNMASWKLRIGKKFPVNFVKFLVWNIMPLTIWMRICALFPEVEAGGK